MKDSQVAKETEYSCLKALTNSRRAPPMCRNMQDRQISAVFQATFIEVRNDLILLVYYRFWMFYQLVPNIICLCHCELFVRVVLNPEQPQAGHPPQPA